MHFHRTPGSFAFAVVLLLLTPSLHAQSPEDGGKGLIWYENVQGSSNVDGQATRFDSIVRYNFNRYFGADLGVPFLFVRADSTGTTSGSTSANGIGNVYTDLLSFAKIQIRLNQQSGEACNIVTRAKIQGRGVLAKDRSPE